MGKNVLTVVVLVFAAIGLLCVIGAVAMAFTHGSMMAGMCNGSEGVMMNAG